jgi:hypothetical protein
MDLGSIDWCVALGDLFGGLVPGISDGQFGPVEGRGSDDPGVMWMILAALATAGRGSEPRRVA